MDLQPLYLAFLHALVRFVAKELSEIVEASNKESEGEEVDRKEMVSRLVTKTAFREFWAEIKEEGKANPEVWEGVECPV
jgi:hypothetical protein